MGEHVWPAQNASSAMMIAANKYLMAVSVADR